MGLFQKREEKINCSAVIVAAGVSSRFGGDKMTALLDGEPVLARTLSAFETCEAVSEIVLVAPGDRVEEFAALCDKYGFQKVTKVVLGGETRLESALSGVSETDRRAKFIAIHDGARPLVTPEIIADAIEGAQRHKAAVAAIPARDTVKLTECGFVTETPVRERVYCAQTPQVFDPALIKGALTNALQKGLPVTDDASALEILGCPVFLTAGSEENIKITTPLDLLFAETILAERKARV